jgi:hypothetical protein
MLPVKQASRAYTSLTSAENSAEQRARRVALMMLLASIPLTYAEKTQSLLLTSAYLRIGDRSRGDQTFELSRRMLAYDSPHITFTPPPHHARNSDIHYSKILHS